VEREAEVDSITTKCTHVRNCQRIVKNIFQFKKMQFFVVVVVVFKTESDSVAPSVLELTV